MRLKDEVIGVVRVSTLKRRPKPFQQEHVDRLLKFGEHIATFLNDQAMDPSQLVHHFRIWGAQGGGEIAKQITTAVPTLFGVECCSFFRRDGKGRFVLASTSASENMDLEDQKHFNDFKQGIQDLYYIEDKSKTGICLKEQEPVLLKRSTAGDWVRIINGEQVRVQEEIREEKSHALFIDPDRDHQYSCELNPKRNKSLLLIPVRDVINPRMLAGVLRVVATDPNAFNEEKMLELMTFAQSFAPRLGNTTRLEILRSSREHLNRQLAKLELGPQRWKEAAKIVVEALDADAATIFLRHGDEFRSNPDYTALNDDQIGRDFGPDQLAEMRRHHQTFRGLRRVYKVGRGRTGWPAKNKRILNLKQVGDNRVLKALKVEAEEPRFCEIADPGPFIAAPIMLTPKDRVVGIVRALRLRTSRQGYFSMAHQLILDACTPALAALLKWGQQPPSVVLSYSFGQQDLRDRLVRLLQVVGFDVRYLSSDSNNQDDFMNLVRESSAAIVLATPDPSQQGRKKQLSQNVTIELGMIIMSRIKDRLLILKESDIELPYQVNVSQVKMLEFSLDMGIDPIMIETAETMKEWLQP